MDEERSETPRILPRPEHPISRKLIDSDALWIMNRLRREGFLAYLVGGAVRDLMLGLEPKDFDIGTDARPSEIKRMFRNSRLIGRRFRLVHVYFHRKGQPEKIVEVSTFRSLKQWEQREDVALEDLDLSGNVFGTPGEDAWRRDFSVNALFYDLSDFSVVDYVGGLEDLNRGVIRVIGNPDERFQEDPVRMLRAVEFAARLGFRIESGTEAGIRRYAQAITGASPARLREELRQLQHRGIAAETLAAAHRLGLLQHLIPEATELEGVFSLLEYLDEAARIGDLRDESAYIAALLLPTIATLRPLVSATELDEAHAAIAPAVDALTSRYQISAHIRHQAKDRLLSCYRMARAKAYRAKGKFVRKPEFADAKAFLEIWSRIAGELREVLDYWDRYLEGTVSGKGEKRPRRRRGSRRKGQSSRAESGQPATQTRTEAN